MPKQLTPEEYAKEIRTYSINEIMSGLVGIGMAFQWARTEYGDFDDAPEALKKFTDIFTEAVDAYEKSVA